MMESMMESSTMEEEAAVRNAVEPSGGVVEASRVEASREVTERSATEGTTDEMARSETSAAKRSAGALEASDTPATEAADVATAEAASNLPAGKAATTHSVSHAERDAVVERECHEDRDAEDEKTILTRGWRPMHRRERHAGSVIAFATRVKVVPPVQAIGVEEARNRARPHAARDRRAQGRPGHAGWP